MPFDQISIKQYCDIHDKQVLSMSFFIFAASDIQIHNVLHLKQLSYTKPNSKLKGETSLSKFTYEPTISLYTTEPQSYDETGRTKGEEPLSRYKTVCRDFHPRNKQSVIKIRWPNDTLYQVSF